MRFLFHNRSFELGLLLNEARTTRHKRSFFYTQFDSNSFSSTLIFGQSKVLSLFSRGSTIFKAYSGLFWLVEFDILCISC